MQVLNKIIKENIKFLGISIIERTREEKFSFVEPNELLDEIDDTTIEDVKMLIRDNVLGGLKLNLIIFMFVILCTVFGMYLHKIFF